MPRSPKCLRLRLLLLLRLLLCLWLRLLLVLLLLLWLLSFLPLGRPFSTSISQLLLLIRHGILRLAGFP